MGRSLMAIFGGALTALAIAATPALAEDDRHAGYYFPAPQSEAAY